jgi:DNA (cytosine-5)-methyltransferase 1
MSAYYNENNPEAAAILRELIKQGHIADGVVDERSIEDVVPTELAGYTQCHFFAGIGVWSYALRQAGWPDDRPVWTGSCPCQPFSSAGEGAGFADERHLWPAFYHLISQCRPAIVLGEQVASKDANPWIDLVCADLEAVGFAFGSVAFPSAGVGAPHLRDRCYWAGTLRVDDTFGSGRQQGGLPSPRRICSHGERKANQFGNAGAAFRLGDANGIGAGRDAGAVCGSQHGENGQHRADDAGAPGAAFRLADPDSERCDGFDALLYGIQSGRDEKDCVEATRRGPVNGFWRAADWLAGRDGKWRPVEPGTFPLVDGTPARVVRLRCYGNAINAEAAKAFIEAVM